jgi:excisionase family DNA binding protein
MGTDHLRGANYSDSPSMADAHGEAGLGQALLSVNEAAQRLGVSAPTVYRLIGRGELPVIKIGDRSLFRPRDIDALIERSIRRTPS